MKNDPENKEKIRRNGFSFRESVQSRFCASVTVASSGLESVIFFIFMAIITMGGAVSLDAGQFELEWTDDSDNESGFRIERSLNGVDFELIGEVEPNVEVYVDDDLLSGLTYYYRVYAYNGIGASDYSDIVSGTTPLLAPSVEIANNVSDSLQYEGDEISFITSLDGDVSDLSVVEFYLNDALVSSEAESPWNYSISDLESGSYRVFAKAKNHNGEVSTSSEIEFRIHSRINYDTASGSTITLSSYDVGDAEIFSELSYDSDTGQVDITSGGSDVWGTVDEFNYVWTKLEGNFDLSAKVHSVFQTSEYAKAGIMIRQSLDVGSTYAYAHINAKTGRGLFSTRRQVTNDTSSTTFLAGAPDEQVWLRLSHKDGVVSSYYSVDRVTWEMYASNEFDFEGEVYVGLAVTANHLSEATTAIFSDVDIEVENFSPEISDIDDISVMKVDTIETISIVVSDEDSSLADLNVIAVSSNENLVKSSSLVISGSGANRTLKIEKEPSEFGVTTITVSVSDGKSTVSSVFDVAVENEAPFISTVGDQFVEQGGLVGLFGITLSDPDDELSELIVSISSDNPTLVPETSMKLIGEGADLKFELTPVSSEYGSANILFTVNDGEKSASTSFLLTVERDVEITTQTLDVEVTADGETILSVEATGDNLTYQWYRGDAGDDSSPLNGENSDELILSSVSTDAQYWVKVISEGRILAGGTLESSTININYNPYPRYFYGSFSGGSTGTFALIQNEDGTGAFLGSLDQPDISVKVDNLFIDDGLFDFIVDGLGEFVGEIANGEASIGLLDTLIVGVSIQDEVDAGSSAYAGLYKANMVNSADGEMLIIASPSGKAFVYTEFEGESELSEANIDESGNIGSDIKGDGRIDLELTESFLVEGSSSFKSVEYGVRGRAVEIEETERLVNTSMRAKAGEGASTMIAGFVIGGEGTKQMLIRGVGPALAAQNVIGQISDPKLYLYRYDPSAGFALVGNNDNWNSASNAEEIRQASEFAGAFALPTDGLDAAIKIDLPAGVYSAHVNGGSGTALVEIYDVEGFGDVPESDTTLLNISMRGDIGSGENVVIAGFVVAGDAAKQYLVRSVGDELSVHGISDTLENPNIGLYKLNSEGAFEVVASNDDWTDRIELVNETSAKVGASQLNTASKSSALVVWLEPGVYTAIASGPEGSKGVALVEAYEIP